MKNMCYDRHQRCAFSLAYTKRCFSYVVVKSIIRIYDGFDDSINRDFNRINVLQKNDQNMTIVKN